MSNFIISWGEWVGKILKGKLDEWKLLETIDYIRVFFHQCLKLLYKSSFIFKAGQSLKVKKLSFLLSLVPNALTASGNSVAIIILDKRPICNGFMRICICSYICIKRYIEILTESLNDKKQERFTLI